MFALFRLIRSQIDPFLAMPVGFEGSRYKSNAPHTVINRRKTARPNFTSLDRISRT